MKVNVKWLFIMIVAFSCLSAYTVSAEDSNGFGRPKAITFTGENQNWLVVHQMYLIGTEVKIQTQINYKGDDEKIKNRPLLHYSIFDEGTNVFGTFSLNHSNIYQSEKTECSGCKFLDKKKEVTFIIGEWEEYEERITLRRE
ncbi:hypothetical protein [Alkalihalobacterium chitinilyticum]|uniref:DUF3888 domain-containing protein n=1 Tax=Alkalihalobacterium chitinilyticum TaxID=2980103 RepID=A0ABT5VKS1_9BACI|nr:hypothetical protein [Alkalihalobacterium chitinilyticum]MDE5416043.1 hypothetical protein [Alkalihalobacterium chitinilyticum]